MNGIDYYQALASIEQELLEKVNGDLVAKREIKGSARKIQLLFSCMSLTGMSSDEYRIKANEQIARFKATYDRQDSFQLAQRAHLDDKPLTIFGKPLVVKKQKTARELMAEDPLWAYKKSNIDESIAVARMVAGAIDVVSVPFKMVMDGVCGTTIGGKVCRKASDIKQYIGDVTGINGIIEKANRNKDGALVTVLEQQYLIPREVSHQFAADSMTLINTGAFFGGGTALFKIATKLKPSALITPKVCKPLQPTEPFLRKMTWDDLGVCVKKVHYGNAGLNHKYSLTGKIYKKADEYTLNFQVIKMPLEDFNLVGEVIKNHKNIARAGGAKKLNVRVHSCYDDMLNAMNNLYGKRTSSYSFMHIWEFPLRPDK